MHLPKLCWGDCKATDHALDARLLLGAPKTIEDAIHVAEKIGIPQLWVDQYCINQHDIKMRSATIQSMDMIYGSAALTIIAASGEDAASGLPGIRGTTRAQQRTMRIGRYEVPSNIRDQVRASRWNSCGWTYQEALLSH